jgi:lysophospholipase L1-like esterase
MTTMLKILSRTAFYFFCGVLWIAVIALAMEVTAFMVQRNIEASNPLIVACKQQLAIPHDDSAVTPVSVPVQYPSKIGGWDTRYEMPITNPTLKQALENGLPLMPFGAELREACRKQFHDFTEQEKEIYARLNCEIALVATTACSIQHVYGADPSTFQGPRYILSRSLLYLTRQLGTMQRLAAATIQKQQPHSYTIYLPSLKAPQKQQQMQMWPIPNTDLVHIFMDVYPENVYASSAPQPAADSRWEVPFLRYKPNFTIEEPDFFKTNSLGFRSPEIVLPKPEGIFRILCIGGSTTHEAGGNAVTYPMRLEALLKEAFPEQPCEVVNAGIPGIFSRGHLRRLHDYLQVEPDLIVAHLGVNDVLGIYSNPATNLPAKSSRFLRLFAPSITAPDLDTFQNSLDSILGKNLRFLSEQFQREGIATVFASMPYPDPQAITKEQYQFFNYQGKRSWNLLAFSLDQYVSYIQISNNLLKTIASETQSVYIPLAESMAGVTEVYNDFCHMTQPGIDAKAQIIFDAVKPLVARFTKRHP